jgi:hypothetical protein
VKRKNDGLISWDEIIFHYFPFNLIDNIAIFILRGALEKEGLRTNP